MGNFSTPGGQNADILRATINGESYGEPPTSEISALLIELNQLIISGGGGGGGTTNYNGLTNKPQINGVELKNNKSLAELGIVIPEVDSALSESSENPVQNKVIALKLSDYYTKDQIDTIVAALNTLKLEPVAELPTQDISTTTIYLLETATPGKYEQYLYLNETWVLLGSTDVDLSNYYNKSQVDTLLLAKQAVLTFDNAPTNGSNNPVKSGGIYTALQGKQDTLTFDNAPTEDSDNPVKSGGIYSELIKKLDKFYLDESGLDLDDCTEAGLYEINTSVENVPTGADGGNMLVSHNPTSGAIVQTYFATNGTIASRYKLNSAAWTSWIDPFTNRPALQYAKNVQYTSDAAGNIVFANSINNVVIVSVRVRGNYTWSEGYSDTAGCYIHLMDPYGQTLTNATVTLDIVYYSYDWTAA